MVRFILTFCVLLSCAAAEVQVLRVPDSGIQPQAALDSDGTIHLIYYKGAPGSGDLFYVYQRGGDRSFSKPVQVNSERGRAIAAGTIRGAQVALGRKNRVHVAWNGPVPAGQTYMEAPMLYTRLNDAGTGFEPEKNVITKAHGLDGGGSVTADQKGNVFVMWHAPQPGNTNGEPGRAVFVARSRDEGKSFAPETLATVEPTGACGCCGMRGLADERGNVFAFFRAADASGSRNETLLVSNDGGNSFRTTYSHPWKIPTCPMSSAFLWQSPIGEVLAAGETHGRVFYVRVDAASGKVSDPVSPERKGKHPVVLSNSKGEVLLAWVEGTSWGKGGTLAWQTFDGEGHVKTAISTAEGLPAWSLATGVTKLDGNFVLFY